MRLAKAEGEKGVSTSRRSSVVAIAIASLVLPTAVLAQSACQTTLEQVRTAEEKLSLDFQNGQLQLATNRTNALIDCEKLGIGASSGSTAQSDCVTKENDAYANAVADLQKAYNTAYSKDEQIANDVGGGGCPWSPEEITQFATQVTQAAAQFTQSLAEVISAVKSKSGATTQAQSKPNTPPSNPAAPQSPQPAQPTSPTSGSPQSPKSPASPASP